jgi:hypothetical protein
MPNEQAILSMIAIVWAGIVAEGIDASVPK